MGVHGLKLNNDLLFTKTSVNVNISRSADRYNCDVR